MESLCIYGLRSSWRQYLNAGRDHPTQLATSSQLLALASTWPTLASIEVSNVAHEPNSSGETLTVDIPQAIGLTGRHIDSPFKQMRR